MEKEIEYLQKIYGEKTLKVILGEIDEEFKAKHSGQRESFIKSKLLKLIENLKIIRG